MATKEQVVQVLAVAEQMFPRKDRLTPAAAEIYFTLLGDIPVEELIGALQKHALTNKWFPSVSELRELALPDNSIDAMEAWGQVRRALAQPRERYVYCEEYLGIERPSLGSDNYWTQVGAMNDHLARCMNCKKEPTRTLVDPVAMRVAEGMGLDYLRRSDNEMADRAHFMRAYQQTAQRERLTNLTLPAGTNKQIAG